MKPYRLIIILFLFLSASGLLSDDGLLIEDRDLVWEDFKGPPDPASKFDAYTFWYLKYTYPAPAFNGEEGSVTARAWCELGTNSWVRHGVRDQVKDALLKHEQGHFDICRIHALKFVEKIENLTLQRDEYKIQIEQTFNEVMEEARGVELRYDEETRHMTDEEAQAEWNEYFSEELEEEEE